MNLITEIFKDLTDEELVICIIEIDDPDGKIPSDSLFRTIIEKVRLITKSDSYSTDLLLCQMNIFKEGAMRFIKLKNKI